MPGTSEALLAGLDPEQREVAVAARGPVCVLAGAGTGKTRAITYRIAYAALSGTMDPAHVLALTFTVRAAGELRGRLRQLGVGQVRASTFHAAALRQLNYFWPRVVGGRPPQVPVGHVALGDLPRGPVGAQRGAGRPVELHGQGVLEAGSFQPESLPARPSADLDDIKNVEFCHLGLLSSSRRSIFPQPGHLVMERDQRVGCCLTGSPADHLPGL